MTHTLTDLILAHKGDRSFEQLAEDCGGVPSAGRLHRMVTKPHYMMPNPATVRGLGRGLGVPHMTVVRAAASGLGLLLVAATPRVATLVSDEFDGLDDEVVQAVIQTVQNMVGL